MAIDAYSKKFWDKYVAGNARFAEIKFEIRPGKTTPLYTKVGKSIKAGSRIYKQRAKFQITGQKMVLIGDKPMAEVKIAGLRGLFPVVLIKQPTAENGTKYEDEVVDLINTYITQVGPLNIKLKGDSKVYEDILYAIKVNKKIKQSAGQKSDPKCDIILCRDKNKPLAAGSIYISHKKEGGASAFQQYSGISPTSGEEIYTNRFVKKFTAIVADALSEVNRLEAPVIATFNDKRLMNMAIYGPNFGQAHSLEHVHCIGQGKAKITPSADQKVFTLDFSDHISLSGDLRLFSGPYIPVLAASYRDDRSFTYKGITYQKTRLGIYPFKKVFSNNEETVIHNL